MIPKIAFALLRIFLLAGLMLPAGRWNPPLPAGNHAWPAPRLSESAAAPPPTACIPDSIIILNTHSAEEINLGLAQLEAAGGCAVHILPPDTVIGRLPPAAETALIQAGLLRQVQRQRANIEQLAAISPAAGRGAALWNQVILEPQPEPATPFPGPGGPPPLIDDRRQVGRAAPEYSGGAAGQPASPGADNFSSFLYGKIAVGLFILESSGAIDPQTEDWSSARRTNVSNEVKAAMNWYANTFPKSNLSFVYDEKYLQTPYEPINRSSREDGLWIGDALTSLGYPQANWWEKSYAYLNQLRATYQADWALVIFVVDSYKDSDGKFTDGYFGYSYGFLIVETYDNASWGIDNMASITAHEMAHNFGAVDEYCAPGYACCWGGGQNGYLGIRNHNCEAGCDKNNNGVCDGDDADPGSGCHTCSSCTQVACLMRNGTISNGMDIPSRQQIGARDTDDDGRYDPMDTFPAFNLSPSPAAYTNQSVLTYTGTVTDQPYDSPVPGINDLSINFITAVQVQRDGGSWTACAPGDGRFNTTTESFTCTVSGLSVGAHTIHLRAINRSGNNALWSQNLLVETSLPSRPTQLTSPSHTIAQWSGDATIEAVWAGAGDTGSGVSGYSVTWTESPESLPDTTQDVITSQATSPPLSSGQSWYVHVRTGDAAGNWSPDAAHAGPFSIDATPPSLPTNIDPGCEATDNVWQSTCRDPSFTWDEAADGESGLAGTFYYWGTDPSGTSPAFTTGLTFDPPPLEGEGTYYLRLQTQDQAGVVSAWSTLFTLRYDATPPAPPENLFSPSHSPAVWSNDPTIRVTWQEAADSAGNAAQGFSVEWSTAAESLPDSVVDVQNSAATSPPLADGTGWYVHVRVQDAAGYWSSTAAHYGPFFIDTHPPQAQLIAIDGPICQMELRLNWTGSDAGSSAPASGAAVYDLQYQLVGDEVWQDWLIHTAALSASFGPLTPLSVHAGQFYRFRIRAVDTAGNIGVFSPAAAPSPGISGCGRYLPMVVR